MGFTPGIAFLHGIKTHYVDVSYGGIPGNIINVGTALPEVKTLGDMLNRIEDMMDFSREQKFLESERAIRGCESILETNIEARGQFMSVRRIIRVNKVLHIFPHTGFTPEHLERAVEEHPGIDTLLATISRVYDGHELISCAEKMGINFICGNSHALEIIENGLPLAQAISVMLPDTEVVIFRERMTSTPLPDFGSEKMRNYAENIAADYLIK